MTYLPDYSHSTRLVITDQNPTSMAEVGWYELFTLWPPIMFSDSENILLSEKNLIQVNQKGKY